MLTGEFIFNYPKEFVTMPEYTKRAGTVVRIIRPLTNEEADNSVEQIYEVLGEDNWIGHAWESELNPIK